MGRREVEAELQDPAVCPLKTLRRFIEKEPDGARRRAYVLLYHGRLAWPFSGLVLVGLGLPFVLAHERVRRSRMIGIGVCVLICMIFYTVQFIAADLGQSGHLPPAVAAWLPTVVFGAMGVYMLENVHT